MPLYRIACSEPGCPNEAVYKIAARWSDGLTSELKTYGLVCERCLPKWYRQSAARQSACRRARNETLDAPGIFRLERGTRDAELERLFDREAEFRAPGT